MKKFLILLLVVFLRSTAALAEENSVSEFFSETFKDGQAVFDDKMQDRKTLREVLAQGWHDLWS